ncbi:hypothetical protein [Parafrankia discariae]|uniref:hypothetical protein n=1 Tax=Parafrankia discariae TaxID=365528 RepID=UPI0003A511F3
MLIDCDACAVRGVACGDCVVTVLLAPPSTGVEWDEDERRALAALADAGLIPRLRLAPGGRPTGPEPPRPLPRRRAG